MKSTKDKRKDRRSSAYRTQKLEITYETAEGKARVAEAKLWDFSEGGLGMDSPCAFETGAVISLSGELVGPAYSIALDGSARVVYCRRIESKTYRVGVAFLNMKYRPIAAEGKNGRARR